MPRNMSFFLTTTQFHARTKTVTRRLGWGFLKAGDVVMGVEKGQGIPKGGKVKRLGLIRIVYVRREALHRIPQWDVAKEGFPDMTAAAFIAMFCEQAFRSQVAEDPVNDAVRLQTLLDEGEKMSAVHAALQVFVCDTHGRCCCVV